VSDEDKRAEHQRALLHNAPKAAPRHPIPGEEVWRLRDNDGRVQTCELRDNTRMGAGWDVFVLMNGEPLFSRLCGDERLARSYAQAMKQDNMRGGEWVEAETKDS